MRTVWHVSWEFPPLVYGGLGRHVEQLTRAQHRAGDVVRVVTSAEDVTAPGAADLPTTPDVHEGVHVLRAARSRPRAPWTDLRAAAAELDDALTDTAMDAIDGEGAAARPDVVHAHDWTAAGAAATVAAGLGVPMVLTLHATEFGRRAGRLTPDEDGDLPAAVHDAELRAVKDADAVVVCSAAMRAEAVEALGADPTRVHVVANAVDADAWTPTHGDAAAMRLRFAGNGPLVVAAGRLEWEKGFSTLLRAVPAVRAACPGLRVVLAGRGSYEPTLRARIDELDLSGCVDLVGWFGPADLAALYGAADAVVVPSRYEPSGLVAREAQAAGAAVVAASVGGLVDAVTDGVTGRRFAPGDVDALAVILVRLARSPDEARRLGRAAAAAVRTRSWNDVARETTHVYDRLKQRSTPAQPCPMC